MGETISVDIMPDEPHDPTADQIAALGRAQPTGDEAEPEGEPTLLAGKYKDAAELEKAYLELQKLQGSQTKEEPAETGGDGLPFSFDKEGAAADVAPSKLTTDQVEAFEKEIIETKTLSEASQQAIRDRGFPQSWIDTHIRGVGAIQENRSNAIVGMFGNRERMESIIQWANNNLPQGELDTITSQANSTEMGTCETAIKGLVARFDSSPMGQEAPLEGMVGGPSIQGFKSTREMTEAMGDPKYRVDPAYRAEIHARVAATT